jgi:hypothetical protein
MTTHADRDTKLFTHAGISLLDNKYKVRYATDAARIKVLAKNGHRNIDLIELKHPMTKRQAIDYLVAMQFDNGNRRVAAALLAEQIKRTPASELAATELVDTVEDTTEDTVEDTVEAEFADEDIAHLVD